MPRFSTGDVTRIVSERRGMQRVEVDGQPAYVLTELIGPVVVGDRVVVNTTAVELDLGTGGWNVVHWNLSRREWSRPGPGTVMKLRYTSLQADVGAAEEDPRRAPLAGGLDGTPVVACGLHSQIAPVAAAFADAAPGRRLGYLMTDGAALPLALSELVADLQAAALLDLTVTCGQAFGGDHEAVNVHSGLQVAVAAGADAVVVAAGPGGVGTGTRLGFTALEVATVIDAAALLAGRPVAAVRFSDADPRKRHQGVSEHTIVALGAAARPSLVAVPRGEAPAAHALDDRHPIAEVDVADVAALLAGHALVVRTMGRGPDEDPGFFRWAAAAGVVAAQLLAGT